MKLTKHTNIRAKTVKLFRRNTGKNYCDPGLDNSFSNVTHQKHKQQKKNTLILIKILKFCTSKTPSRKLEKNQNVRIFATSYIWQVTCI